ncbi:hypothetical protein PHMEG_00028448 [Phytophthora megakarya]|uniref:Small vasohibin-binding protein n=1 Tax=Phytophthora megakarya TaxID=4795 RepID=A0A225V5I9_9STRA|nr:hypothetical protein PHMEG_00028448 [Phytophthora megakarya]
MTVKADSTQNLVANATIEPLPRGTALNAARTPRSKTKDAGRNVSFSRQPTGTDTAKHVQRNSTSTNLKNGSDHEVVPVDPETEPTLRASNSGDLAKRAARRVNVWKKSEKDKKGEEERARQVKQEQDKRRQNHTAQVKQRRRAEIYALNALLRQLQQEKIAGYIAAQKQVQEVEQQVGIHMGSSLTNVTALALVEAVGA